MSALGHKQTLGGGALNVRFTPESGHRNGFITEDGYGTTLRLMALGHTENENLGTPQSQI